MIGFLRALLWPLSFIYGFVITLRNYLYDWGILKSRRFDFPVIVIGNLAIGGAGKSPMAEYLIRLLTNSFRVATLSRGYGRKTKGFIEVEVDDSTDKVGDEPLQFKSRYPEITVAVCEDRVAGVTKLQNQHDVVILDDAFQHRRLVPGLSILLLEYESLFKPILLLPAGNFRDSFSQRKRADIIIISKSPHDLSERKKQRVIKKINPQPKQSLLFSYLEYGEPYSFFSDFKQGMRSQPGNSPIHGSTVLLVTGIANPQPLIKYLEKKCHLQLLSYPDHHDFTPRDIESIRRKFFKIETENKYILTTEKDSQRFKKYKNNPFFAELPIWVIPVETSFSSDQEEQFSSIVINYCNRYYN